MEKEVSNKLKKAGLKVTPARKIILDVFSKNTQPINAEFILCELKKEKMDQVTVYRSLSSMLDTGIIKQVDLRKNSTYYELVGSHHHHLVCTECGLTEDFEVCDVEDLTKKALSKSSKFKTIQQHSFELFGVCKTCAKR